MDLSLSSPTLRWATVWLRAAGCYNLCWGAVTIAAPNLWFDLTGTPRLNHPEIWQCVGMIVGVYGIGYLIAAENPRTHWPIVLVGLLGKIFGPIGFAFALARGSFPLAFGATILTNDLLWWIPFTAILIDAARHRARIPPRPDSIMQFVKESRIHAPPEEVFRFHQRPDALQLLTPSWETMRVVESSGSLLSGSRVVLEGRFLLFPLRWVAVHTEYDPPRVFADEQERGPFAYWRHRHMMLPDGDNHTILRDEVEYVLPLGWVGRWFGGRLIRKRLSALFDYRHETTRRLIEAGGRANLSMSAAPGERS